MEKEILKDINEIIEEEHGNPVDMGNLLIDSQLDSLGMMLTLLTIDSKFGIFNFNKDEDVADLDIPNLTIKDIVKQCVLSKKGMPTEPFKKKGI